MPAVEYEIRYDESTLAGYRGTAWFDFGAVPGGYAWVFPKAGHLSIGAGVVAPPRGRPANLHDATRAYAERLGLDFPDADHEPDRVQRHGFVIPIGKRSNRLARGRVLLVGDAAGLADSLTGEGVTLAAASGALAANAVIDQAHRGPERVSAAYHRALGETLLPELRVASTLSRVMYGLPWLRDRLFAARGPQLTERMTDIVAGDRTYAEAIPSPRRWLMSMLMLSSGDAVPAGTSRSRARPRPSLRPSAEG